MLMITLIAAAPDVAAAERSVRAIGVDMRSNIRRAYTEYHAMAEAQRSPGSTCVATRTSPWHGRANSGVTATRQIERTGSGALEDCAHIGQRGGKLARALDEIARHVEERAFQIIDFVSQGVDLGLMARAEFADGSGHNIETESHALVVGPAQASALCSLSLRVL